MLLQEKIHSYKGILEAERKRLLDELAKHEKPVDFGSDTDHFDEEADEAEELGNQIAADQAVKDRLSEIDVALSRIHSGQYGICEKCGSAISEQVLDIVPESHLCAECKKSR